MGFKIVILSDVVCAIKLPKTVGIPYRLRE